jgi:probable FeS assembly SUF system protein SufT
MHGHESVVLQRDCEAVLIPYGTPVSLREGTEVFIAQALGGTVTVNVNGNLARINGKDLDAIGMEPVAPSFAANPSQDSDGPVDESLLWEQLATCYDPEIPIKIVELGLIYSLEVEPLPDSAGNRVSVQMTLTAPGCGMGEFLVEDVRSKLEQVPNVTEVVVDLVFDPPWDQSMMSEAARLQTGIY